MQAPVTHILPLTYIRRPRLLPVPGRVLVHPGQKVNASDIVAEGHALGQHILIDVRRALGITRADEAVSLKLPLSAEPVRYIVVLGARPQSPGVSYVDHYRILGLLPDPEGGLSDITDLYLAKFHLLPVGHRIFIRTVQQINGCRDLPKTVSARILAQ